MLEAKIPDGPLEQKWSRYRSNAKLVSTGNRRKLHVIVVGTGLSGSSLAASLGEMGHRSLVFAFRIQPGEPTGWLHRAESTPCKNYKNAGKYRLPHVL